MAREVEGFGGRRTVCGVSGVESLPLGGTRKGHVHGAMAEGHGSCREDQGDEAAAHNFFVGAFAAR